MWQIVKHINDSQITLLLKAQRPLYNVVTQDVALLDPNWLYFGCW